MEAVKKNITKIYILTTLSSFIFVGPIIVLFMQERELSFKEIMILESIFAIAIFILEVPSGYISDQIGRVKTIIIAKFIMLISHLTLTFSTKFWQFLVAEILFALYFALISGTLEAFVYESLIALNKAEQYKKVMGNIRFIGFLSAGIGAVIGGLLSSISFQAVFLANTINILIAPFVALKLVEPNKKEIRDKKMGVKEVIRATKDTFFNGTALKWIILLSSVVYMFNQSAFWFYQPYLKLSGVEVVYFGIIFASFQFIAAISAKFAYKIEAKIGLYNSLQLITLLTAMSLILMGSFVAIYSFLFIYMQQFTRSVKSIIISDIINKNSPKNYRATILSIASFVDRVFIAILLPILGYVEGAYGIKVTLILMGVSLVVGGAVLLYIIKRNFLPYQ